jgi:diguanylate cyclase (GGDEF)-like protein
VAIPENVPAEMCTALVQDTRGFLWIGTQSGVVRWDGLHFKVHPPPPGASYVRTLLATRDGRVWAGTFSGGVVVYGESGEVARYGEELSHPRVEGLAEDRDGRVWVATQEGLDRIDPKTRRVEHVRTGERMRGLLVDRAGQLWVGSRAGLQVNFRNVPGLERDFVTKLFEDDRGRIWIGTAESGAAVFDPRTNALHRIEGLSHFWIYGITQVGQELWLATFGGGLNIVDADTLQVIDILRHDATLPNTIGGDRIGALLRDRSGTVWVGTWGQGLARHDPQTRAFRTLRYSPSLPEGLTHAAAVRPLQMHDGTIWVGTNGDGVDVFDRELRRIGNYSLGKAAVTALAQASDGTAYVATLDGDLQRLRAGIWTRITKTDGLPGGPIRAMTFAPNGDLWVGASDGMARIEGRQASGVWASSRNGPEARRPTPILSFRHDRYDARTLSGHAVEAIAFTRDGTMWVGTDNGLNVFDPARGVATRVDGLPNNWAPDLMVARDGRLWIATNAGACVLTSWDGKRATFRRVTDRPAEALIEDDQGQVWIGARLRVDPTSGTSTEFNASDGCDFRSFFIASRAKTDDGSLLFGSPEGLMVVQPRELRRWTYEPPVVATAVERSARGVRIDFAALDYTAPERNRYRYRLEPFDAKWSDTDASRRSVTYTNLGPGHYTLRVQGTNRSGVWSRNELRLPLRILPAFYETLWFRALAVLVLLALLYAAYRLRVRQLAKRAAELERIVTERTVELQAAYVRIEEASLTDPLTQLRNRRFLEQAIKPDLELAARRGEDLVVLLVDLDHFKIVNDTYGHAAGDAVLTQTAQVMTSVFRASDYVVRWGGEEFLVVARFIPRSNAADLAEKLRVAIESHPFVLPDGGELRKTCSIGVAAYPSNGLTFEQVVQRADEALYEAKRSGRNRFENAA